MDNRYSKYGCPGILIDSRNLTNYYPRRAFEQFIRGTNNLESAHDYKAFLQQNADTIMERESDYIIKNNTCAVNGSCNMANVPLKQNNDTFHLPMYANKNVPAPSSEHSVYAELPKQNVTGANITSVPVTNNIIAEASSEGYTLHPNTFAKLSS